MSLFFLYEKLQCIEIDDSCGNGHERRVETVEHTAMSWQQCAAVLYSQSAFEETLYQVAPCSEEHDNQAQSHPSGNAESVSLAVICQSRQLQSERIYLRLCFLPNSWQD